MNVLYEDRKGTLWVGTTGALNRYDKATHASTRLELPDLTGNSDVLPAGRQRCPGGSGGYLRRIVGRNIRARARETRCGIGQDETLPPQLRGQSASLSNDTVTHLLVDHTGAVWATTADGLGSIRSCDGPLPARFGPNRPGARPCMSRSWKTANTLFGSVGQVVCFTLIPATESISRFRGGVCGQGYGVLAASNGEIWAASQQGLYRFDPSANTVRQYTERDGLPSGAISCLLEDFEHNIWVSTTEGLSRYLHRIGPVSQLLDSGRIARSGFHRMERLLPQSARNAVLWRFCRSC